MHRRAQLTCTPPEDALTSAAAASMTSEGTSSRDGEHAAASDMGMPSSGGGLASGTVGRSDTERPPARSRSEGLAAFGGVPSAGPSRARFVGVAPPLFVCTYEILSHRYAKLLQQEFFGTIRYSIMSAER